MRTLILATLAFLAVQPGVANGSQPEEEQMPATILTVRTEPERVDPTYDEPGETAVVIDTSPYASVRFWNTGSPYGNRGVWQLLPEVPAGCEGGEGESCGLNVLEGEGSSDRPWPWADEAKGQPVEPSWSQTRLEEEGKPREIPRGATMIVPWSCRGQHVGRTITFYISEQGGSGAPLEYVGHFKEGISRKWCSAAKRKREHQEHVARTRARARAKHREIERIRREREERERQQAEERFEEHRFESNCRAVGGIPVTVLNSEHRWVIVCRSKAGGTIPVP
jgi:hypothetical protein